MRPSDTAAPSLVALWGPVALYMALIFWVSSMSSPPAPGAVNDKVLHIGCYGGLAALTLRATAGGRLSGVTWTSGLLAWAIATAYGATDEFHQAFVPLRSVELADLAADAVGAALAVAVLGAFGIIARSRAAGRSR